MKRTIALIAVLAGLALVGNAVSSQVTTGPTLKQFAALKAQVATLSSQVKNLHGDVADAQDVAASASTTATNVQSEWSTAQPTLSCLKTQWDGLVWGQWGILGNYGGTTAVLTVTIANMHQC